MRQIVIAIVLIALSSNVLLGQLSASKITPIQTANPNAQVVNELIRIEHEWHTALEKNDIAKLDLILATDWIITNGSGTIFPKSVVLSDLRSGDTKFVSTVPSEIRVHVYKEAAVVTKISTDQTKYGNSPGGGRYQMTDMFVKLDGRWQCIATHSSHDIKQ